MLEARPRGASKGDALRAFMLEGPFIGRTPVFIGDDVTDEDGFIAAQDLGGIGIKLGDGEPRPACALPMSARSAPCCRGWATSRRATMSSHPNIDRYARRLGNKYQ
ncbi:MAG: hypothetical protein MO852_05750 [Candidatus Devosia euplotis]|nr:hypothetical protein [Candidatus Devosia euplotis]